MRYPLSAFGAAPPCVVPENMKGEYYCDELGAFRLQKAAQDKVIAGMAKSPIYPAEPAGPSAAAAGLELKSIIVSPKGGASVIAADWIKDRRAEGKWVATLAWMAYGAAWDRVTLQGELHGADFPLIFLEPTAGAVVTFWNKRSTVEKVAIVGVPVLCVAAYALTRKKKVYAANRARRRKAKVRRSFAASKRIRRSWERVPLAFRKSHSR